MKRTIVISLVVIGFVVAADRICKVYEKNAAGRETVVSLAVNPALTQEQIKDYKNAATFRLLPYEVFVKPGFRSGTVNVNSAGLRGEEIEKKRPGSYRIAVIGGSSVFGGEVPSDDSTFLGLLEKRLNGGGRLEYDVINAGVPAYVSMQELILLEDKIIGFDPDMVVVFDGFNDALTSLKRDPRPNYPWWFSEIEKIYYTSISRLFLEKKLKKYRPTKLLLNWLERKKEKRREFRVNTEQVAFYKRNLDLMCHLAKSYGIDTILVFQPVALYKDHLSASEENMIGALDPEYVKSLKEMCDLEKAAMREVAAANGVKFIDGTSFFDNVKGDIFLDEVHFNQNGHDIVADILLDAIASNSHPAAENAIADGAIR